MVFGILHLNFKKIVVKYFITFSILIISLKILFYLVFRLDNFFGSIFKFPDSFLSHIHSVTERFQLTFCFYVSYLSALKLPFGSFVCLLFSVENVYCSIHFKTVHLYFVEHSDTSCVEVFV